MTKAITIKVTDKTDFEEYNALRLGDVMTFDGRGVYTFSDGIGEGTYSQEWLVQMLASGAFAEVLSERSFQGLYAPEWATAIGLFKGVWYWEEDIKQSNGARFQSITGKVVCKYDNHSIKGWDQYKILPAFVEEQLPPAPESVTYAETGSPLGTDSILRIGKSKFDGLLLELVATCHVDGAYAAAGMRLDVDDALQLASDLRRIAMAVKRKLKEQDNA